jgi:glycosyltransferase involved in cell wall biosynthesis
MSHPKRLTSISAVLPAYNDRNTIPGMIAACSAALGQVTGDYEIIVTDDGSRDGTGQVLEELVSRNPHLRVFHHKTNRGYGAALRTGFAAAHKEWIFYTDGDAQYDPHELVDLVGALREGVDVVNGYKLSRGDALYRVVIGRAYHYFVRWAFGFRLKDVDCDFRLFKRSLLDEIELKSESGSICLEMVKKFQDAGYRFAEVPVHHYQRPHGTSQFFRPRHLANTARRLVSLWWELVIRKNAKIVRDHGYKPASG